MSAEYGMSRCTSIQTKRSSSSASHVGIDDSEGAGAPGSSGAPHTHTTPCLSAVAYATPPHRRSMGPSLGSAACGTRVQAPSRVNVQPWYGHSSWPSASTRPSESGAARCGHESAIAAQRPPSHQSASAVPNSSMRCGVSRSVTLENATGYHCSRHDHAAKVSALAGAEAAVGGARSAPAEAAVLCGAPVRRGGDSAAAEEWGALRRRIGDSAAAGHARPRRRAAFMRAWCWLPQCVGWLSSRVSARSARVHLAEISRAVVSAIHGKQCTA